MLRFGIYKVSQLENLGVQRRNMGARLSYNLLDVGDAPSPEQIQQFEDICFTMRLSNGTYRTSFRNRFTDLNARVSDLFAREFPPEAEVQFQDRAVSHGLTAYEWAVDLLQQFPRATFEASDLLLDLRELRLPDGKTYIAEPDGTVLQAIAPPFVLSLFHKEPRRYPVNQWMADRERQHFEALSLPADWTERENIREASVRKISLIHPDARLFMAAEPRFRVMRRSVFDIVPASCHGLRTMNILNYSYFSEKQLQEGASAAFQSLLPGGFWIVGRTTEDTFVNNVSVLRRGTNAWELVDRLGEGSEIEALVLAARYG